MAEGCSGLLAKIAPAAAELARRSCVITMDFCESWRSLAIDARD
jgi:hypothetical protein